MKYKQQLHLLVPGKLYRTTNGGYFWKRKGSSGVTMQPLPEGTILLYLGLNDSVVVKEVPYDMWLGLDGSIFETTPNSQHAAELMEPVQTEDEQ